MSQEPDQLQTEQIQLEYAKPETLGSKMEAQVRFCFYLAVCPMCIGLLILFTYSILSRLSSWLDVIPAMAGLAWLVIGGIITLFAIVRCVRLLITSNGFDQESVHTSKRLWFILLLAILNIPVAMFCVYVGLHLGSSSDF